MNQQFIYHFFLAFTFIYTGMLLIDASRRLENIYITDTEQARVSYRLSIARALPVAAMSWVRCASSLSIRPTLQAASREADTLEGAGEDDGGPQT